MSASTRNSSWTALVYGWIATVLAATLAVAEEPDRFNAFKAKPLQNFRDNQSYLQLQDLTTSIIREILPSEYENVDDWGQEKSFVVGVHIRRDGWKLKTSRRRKSLNHGDWKKYRIRQIHPRKNLALSIHEYEELDDGRVRFRVDLTCAVNAMARWQQWNRGIRIASLSVNAHAKMRIQLWVTLGIQLNPIKFPPDIKIEPDVTKADIQLNGFHVNRIGKLHGDIAEELGKQLRKLIQKKIENKRTRLVAKINKKIKKDPEPFTFSLQDLISAKWHDWTDSSENPTGSQKRRKMTVNSEDSTWKQQ